MGHPLPTPYHPRRLRISILAPTALVLGAYGASAPGASIRPLATPSGSALDSVVILALENTQGAKI